MEANPDMLMTRCARCEHEFPTDAPGDDCPRCLLGIGLEPAADAPAPSFTPPELDELAPLFPEFELLELIGHGGMGVVYRARQLKLDREVALKVLPAELGRDAAFSERFRREARTIARLSHPGVVGIHDFGEAGPHPYLVLELVEGATLRELLADRPRLEQALDWLGALFEAVGYAHEQGLVHRDLKPENVLVDERGRVRVVDFGLAKVADAARHSLLPSLTGTRVAVGTPHYMAPEQLEGQGEATARADVYSLGVLAYELLTGRLPLGRFPNPRAEVPGLPQAVDALILEALSRDPEDRPADAAELTLRLANAQTERARPSTPASAAGSESAGQEPGAGGEAAATRRALWTLFGVGVALVLTVGLKWATAPIEGQMFSGMVATVTGWNGSQQLFGLSVPTWLVGVYGTGLLVFSLARLLDRVQTHPGVLFTLNVLALLQFSHFALVALNASGTLDVGPLLGLGATFVGLPQAILLLRADGVWPRPPETPTPASKAYSRGASRSATPSRQLTPREEAQLSRLQRKRRRRRLRALRGAEPDANDDANHDDPSSEA